MKHFVILQDRSCTSNCPTSGANVSYILFHTANQNGRKLSSTCYLTNEVLFICVGPFLAEGGGFTCKTSAIADIVILVDGSWSIGRINFRLVRTFLENLVRAFTVESDETRIGEQPLASVFQMFLFIAPQLN